MWSTTGVYLFETQIIEIKALEIWEYMRKFKLHHPEKLFYLKFPCDDVRNLRTDFIKSFGFSGEILPLDLEIGFTGDDLPEVF